MTILEILKRLERTEGRTPEEDPMDYCCRRDMENDWLRDHLPALLEVVEAAKVLLETHRKERMICCEETCPCWDLESALAKLEADDDTH